MVRYIKALPLRKFDDVAKVKGELRSGNMLTLRLIVTKENIDSLRKAVIDGAR